MLITDGRHNADSDAQAAAASFRAQGYDVIAIGAEALMKAELDESFLNPGVGDNVDGNELLAYTGNKAANYYTPDWTNLDATAASVATAINYPP